MVRTMVMIHRGFVRLMGVSQGDEHFLLIRFLVWRSYRYNL